MPDDPTHILVSHRTCPWLLESCLGNLEFESGQEVTIAMADLKDAFYHLSLPQCLRDYFCLPSIRAKDVGISSFGRQTSEG